MSSKRKPTRPSGKGLHDGLTAKQDAFARAYAKHGMASEAYKEAYNAENMSPKTIRNEGYDLIRRPHILARSKKYFMDAVEQEHLTNERLRHHVRERLFHESMDTENGGSVRVRALELTGRLAGVRAFELERQDNATAIDPSKAGDLLKNALISALTSLRNQSAPAKQVTNDSPENDSHPIENVPALPAPEANPEPCDLESDALEEQAVDITRDSDDSAS